MISPDIGGGFGGKVPVYPGYVIAIAASVVLGKPVKWIEDRMENLQADSFARDYHMDAELAADANGKIKALRIKTIADHGYADAQAAPSKWPAGLFSICTGSYDMEQAYAEVDAVYTNKPPGGVAYRCSFRVTEAVHCLERIVDTLALKVGQGSRDAARGELHPEGGLPLPLAAGLGVRQRRLSGRDGQGQGDDRLRRPAQGAGREARARRADGHRRVQLHRGAGRRPVEGLRHPGHQDVRFGRGARAPDRQGDRPLRHQVAGPGPRDHLRADHRRGAGPPGRTRAGGGGRHRYRALRAGHVRQPLDPDRGRRGRDGRARDPRQGRARSPRTCSR